MGLFSRPGRVKTNSEQEPAAKSEPQQSYRGVEVIPHPSKHCAAVEQIAGYRILAAEAPQLPLPDCDEAECQCRYAQYRDRRTDFRRDADVGIGTVAAMLQITDVRSDVSGRRAEDGEDD